MIVHDTRATPDVTVLIVDDQAPFRDAARLVVELSDGFTVIGEADCGVAGVEAAARLSPRLVLMDMNMPDLDGFEATSRIRAANQTIKVLMLSTYEPAEYRTKALGAGAIDFVAKDRFDPFVLEDAWNLATSS